MARFFSFYIISVSFTSLASLSFFFTFPSILYPFILQTSLVCKSLSSKQCRSMYSSRPSLFFRLISFYFTAHSLCNRTISFIFYEVNIFLVKHSTPRCFFCVSLFHARFVLLVITLVAHLRLPLFQFLLSTIRQFVDIDKFFSYILVKEIDVINAISVLLLILILTLSLVLLTLLVTHIFAIKITSQEIFVIFQIYHYSMFYSFFYLFLSFVLSHLIERIFFISQ